MRIECIEPSGPELSIWLKPVVEFRETFRPQAIDAPLTILPRAYKASFPQDAEMLRDTRLTDCQCAYNFADRPLAPAQKVENLPPVGLCEDFEDGIHTVFISHQLYNCQAI
jgi:hypothetical protein